MHAQQDELSGDPALIEETDRRVATLEDLFAKILRFAVVVALMIVFLGVFDLWSVVAGLGLVLAALTLAGQSIILDYLMGILILTEGQYFKGDVVQLGTVEGTVEEVGLRRTVVRDARGTVHSVSNGTIRVSSNRTRTYALATVDLDGIADRDVEGVIEVLDAVGLALSEDEAFAPMLLDVPGVRRDDPAVVGRRDAPPQRTGPAGRAGPGRGRDAAPGGGRHGRRGHRADPARGLRRRRSALTGDRGTPDVAADPAPPAAGIADRVRAARRAVRADHHLGAGLPARLAAARPRRGDHLVGGDGPGRARLRRAGRRAARGGARHRVRGPDGLRGVRHEPPRQGHGQLHDGDHVGRRGRRPRRRRPGACTSC